MLKSFIDFYNFLPQRSKKWILISSLSALALVFIEIGIAGALQILLVALGAKFDHDSMPAILRAIPPETSIIAILLISIAALRAIFQLLQGQGNFMIRESVLLSLREAILVELLSPKSSFVRSAEIQTRIAEVFPKASLCSYHIISGLIGLIQTIGLGGALFYLSWKDSLIAMIGVVLVGLASRASSIQLRKAGAKMPLAQLRLNEGLQRIARNWLYVKIMRTEPEEMSRLSKEIREYNEANMNGVFWTNANGVIAPFLGVILIVTIVHLSQHIWQTPGSQMLSFLYMLVRFVAALTLLVNAHSALSLNRPQLEAAMKIFKNIQENFKSISKPSDKPKISSLKVEKKTTPPSIELNDVTKTFPDSKRPIINHLTVKVTGGSQLGILGPSGSGKSTLLNIALGILAPDQGSASIGGINAKEAFDSCLYRLGYVGPDPLLIEGTLADNLKYGLKSQPSELELWNILKQVHLADRVRELPDGLATIINEHADIFSAGQKQRLSLSRALLNNPEILILDEASSNLDEATEASIVEVINSLKGKCTTMIVSHRKSFLTYADQVITLDDTSCQ